MSAADTTPAVDAPAFAWPVRVYYEDTDAGGIVYHANYLKFMERARTEWLRALGFEQDELSRRHGVLFVITRADLEFLRAARFNDALTMDTALVALRGASLDLRQQVLDGAGTVLCRAVNSVACVDGASLKPRRLPAHMTRVFKGAH